jgi:hypothetical protein
MRFLCCLLLCAPVLIAQNFRGQIQIKPLVPAITKPWPRAQVFEFTRSPQTRPCAIPLSNVPPRDGDPKMAVPPPSGGAVRMVTPPAPPCEKQ